MKKPTHSTNSSPRKSPHRKIADFAMVGSSSALVLVALLGCDNPREQDFVSSNQTSNSQTPSQAIKQGAFVIVEEQLDGSYKVLEEYPSATTRVVVRDKSGAERILSDEEVDELIKKEAARVENGTSELLAPAAGGAGEQSGSGGLGLGRGDPSKRSRRTARKATSATSFLTTQTTSKTSSATTNPPKPMSAAQITSSKVLQTPQEQGLRQVMQKVDSTKTTPPKTPPKARQAQEARKVALAASKPLESSNRNSKGEQNLCCNALL